MPASGCFTKLPALRDLPGHGCVSPAISKIPLKLTRRSVSGRSETKHRFPANLACTKRAVSRHYAPLFLPFRHFCSSVLDVLMTTARLSPTANQRRGMIHALRLLMVGCALWVTGCTTWNPWASTAVTPSDTVWAPVVPKYSSPGFVAPAGVMTVSNPVHVAVTDRDAAWDQIVDVVDDYFKIERENRVKPMGDLLIEGFIETFPQTGSTLLEPWRTDSVGFYQRLESTLQSIRRRAFVRVIPDTDGYLVEVQVFKELEDMVRPMNATAGAAIFRYDDSIDRYVEPEPIIGRQIGDQPRPVASPGQTAGWIGLGRDTELEQVMLARIQQRLSSGPLPVLQIPEPINPAQSAPQTGIPGPALDVGLPPSNLN